MARLAFIGDSHLGYRHRFKLERLMDFANAFEEAVEKALNENPDAIVFMGDLLHHPRPDPVSFRVVMKNLIKAAGRSHVIVLVGNHEIEGHLGTTYSPVYSDVHERIHVLTSEKPHVILDLGGRRYGFHGFEFLRSPERAKEMLAAVSSELEGELNILCLHQGVEGYVSPHEISLQLLRHTAQKYQLVVLGHIHKRQRVSEVFDVAPAYYVGSTERTSFTEAENPTGYMVFDGDDFGNPRYVEVSSRPMEHIRGSFKGSVADLNRILEEKVSGSGASLLRLDYEVELDGDIMDVRRDFSALAAGKLILEVNVTPKSQADISLEFERITLDEGLIAEYFEKTGNQNEKLKEMCLELYRKYGS